MFKRKILFVLILAAVLRLLFLANHDVTDDEALIAARATGLYDYLEIYTILAPTQTLASEQWWQKFSYHDHPPLGIWLEHLSLKIFGDNAWGIRLPFALAGIGAVYLIYLIGRRVINEAFGISSALVMSVLNYHLWASRVGFLESIEIFFILLALWFFLRTFDSQKWWLAVGVTTGAALLTKYFAVILLPLLFILVLVFQKRAFRGPWLYLGVILCIFTLTPVIIYNYNLFLAKGYFDSPLSQMLGRIPDDYKATLGEHVPGRFNSNLPVILLSGFSPYEILLAFSGLILLIKTARVDKDHRFGYFLVGSYTLLILLLLLFIPIRKQYVTLATPAFAWLGGYVFSYLKNFTTTPRLQRAFLIIGGALLVGALAVSINSQFLEHPLGREDWTFRKIRPDFYNYRYLDEWLRDFYKDHFYRFSFYEEAQIIAFQKKLFDKHPDWVKAPASEREFMVYDSTIDFAAVRWLFIRRKLYELRPIMLSENFLNELRRRPDLYDKVKARFDVFYFIFLSPQYIGEQLVWKNISVSSKELLDILAKANQNPEEVIRDDEGRDLFWIFKVPVGNLPKELFN